MQDNPSPINPPVQPTVNNPISVQPTVNNPIPIVNPTNTISPVQEVNPQPEISLRTDLGVFEKFILLLSNPKLFFETIGQEEGFSNVIKYYMVFLSIGLSLSTITSLITGGDNGAYVKIGELNNPIATLVCFPVLLIISSILLFIAALINAALTHLSIFLFKGSKGFDFTFRIILYILSSTLVFSTFSNIPIVGEYLYFGLWVLPLGAVIYGIHIVHKIPIWKAALAHLLPMVIVIAGIVILYISILSTVFGNFLTFSFN